jgi:hypothetical protein
MSTGATHALATPWGALAVHSFSPAQSVEPNAKAVNAEVARLLDAQAERGTLVAAR